MHYKAYTFSSIGFLVSLEAAAAASAPESSSSLVSCCFVVDSKQTQMQTHPHQHKRRRRRRPNNNNNIHHWGVQNPTFDSPPSSSTKLLLTTKITTTNGNDSNNGNKKNNKNNNNNNQNNNNNDYNIDEECSIDNLDACMVEFVKDVEDECIDDYDACMEVAKDGYYDDDIIDFDTSVRKYLSLPIVEVQIGALVVLSSFIVGLSTLNSITWIESEILKYFELVLSSIFATEYVLRWKINKFSPAYVLQPLAILNLIAVLPAILKIAAMNEVFFFEGMSSDTLADTLVNIQLLRVLRLQRALVDYNTFQKLELALGLNPSDTRPYQLQLAKIVITIYTLLSVTAGLVYTAENQANPDIPDYFTALYFTLTTLTTVGFGDIQPVTAAGRWVVSISILVASFVVPAQAAELAEALLNRKEQINNNFSSSRSNNNSQKDTTYTQNDNNSNIVIIDATTGTITANTAAREAVIKTNNDDDDDDDDEDDDNDFVCLEDDDDDCLEDEDDDTSDAIYDESSLSQIQVQAELLSRMRLLEDKVGQQNNRIDRLLDIIEKTNTEE